MKNLAPLITLLLVLLAISRLQAQCPAQLQLNGIQHGLFVLDDLTPTDPNAQTDVIAFKQYSVLLKTPLSNPKIIVALAQISTLTSTIDLFDINIIAKTETQFVLGFIYEPMKWKQVSYRYLINNRTDLNFQMITLSSVSFQNSNNNFIIAQTQLEQELKNFQKYQVLSFIRGLKYKNDDLTDHSLAVSIVSGNLSSNKISFNISSVTNSNKIELQLLSVSYLYFDPKQATFASFGGLISRSDFVGKSLIDILHADLPTNLYWLYGITTIDFTGKSFTVTSQITEDSFFNLETSISIKKIDFTYFSIAGKAAQVCQNCPDKIISGAVCRKDCLPNQIYYVFKDGSKACQKCTGNLFADAQRKKCVDNISNSVSRNTPTQSNLEYQQNQTYRPVNPNQDTLSQIRGSGVQATSSSVEKTVPSESTQREPFFSTERLNLPPGSETSVTPSSMIEEFNYCNVLEHSYWTGESCQCKVGFKLLLGSCVALVQIEEFKNPETIDETAPLVNPTQQGPYHRGHPERGSNIDADKQMLVKLVPVQNSPVIACPSDLQVYNTEKQHCECREGLGYKANLEKHLLECANCSTFAGYYLENGRCQYCGQNQLYDETKKTCECKEGYDLDEYGDCFAKKVEAEVPIDVISTTQEQENGLTETASLTTTETVPQRTRIRDALSLVNTESLMAMTSPTTNDNDVTQTTVSPSTTTETSAQTSTATPVTQPEPTSASSITPSTTATTIPSSSPSQTSPAPVPAPAPVSATIPFAVPSPSPSLTPTPTKSTECMKLTKTPQINAANIYISLQLSAQRSFKSEDQMQNFLKQDFSQDSPRPSSVYCMQSDVSLKEFDCLLLYPTGVPNSNFQIRFWYNDSALGNQCSLKVPVNPLESAAKSLRSLRRRTA